MRKKINKENTFIVAILTESGAPFNEEGVKYVHDMIAENHPELKDKAIIAMMGNTVYRPEQLASVLEVHPDMFIIISYDGGEYLTTLSHDDMPALAKAIRNTAARNPKVTSWEIFNDVLKEEEENHV